ncbi:MAG TPA: hypothetical protein VI731_10465 [Bacteroidia bacterium]|nr:hypothetical protein [Bacteroidia bacterium]
MNGTAKREAEIFGAYLLGEPPNAKSVSLYEAATRIKPLILDAREEKLLRFLLNNSWSAGMIDSALGFFDRKNGVRKKILYMSAILETQPEYADLFLPKVRNGFYSIYILWVGIRAVAKAIVGRLLIAMI